MSDLLYKIRRYIGPLEVAIILVVTFAVAFYLDYKEEKRIAQQQLLERIRLDNADLQTENERIKNEQQAWMQGQGRALIVLDSMYIPFLVDSLCRYTDTTCTKGFITMTKYAPYKRLLTDEKDYYMWVGLERFFTGGQLVQVTGVAQNEQLIQFHFKINKNEGTLDDMVLKLDSTLQSLQRIQMNARSR